MSKLIGTDPNQVPSNADLGTLAYQDSDRVTLGQLNLNDGTQSRIHFETTWPEAKHWSITNEGNANRLRFMFTDNAQDANAEPFFYLTSDKRVGIGTGSPNSPLEIATSDNVNNYSDGAVQVVSNTPMAFVAPSNLNPSLNRWGFKLRETTDGDFSIHDYRQGATRLLIDGAGKVGIGTTNPDKTLHIVSSDVGPLKIHSTNANGSYIRLSNVTTNAEPDHVWIGAQGNDTKFFQSNTLLSMIIKSDGKVGIGASQPTAALHILEDYNVNTSNNTLLKLERNYSDIDGSGTLGQSNFIEFLFTDSNATFTPQCRIGLVTGDTDGADAGVPSEGNGIFVIQTSEGTDNSGGGTIVERFRINEKGNVNIKNKLGINQLNPSAPIDINSALPRKIHQYIDPRGAADGVYSGYLILAKAHQNPGTSGHPAHKVFGRIRADRGNTGSGNSYAEVDVSSATAWSDHHLYAKSITRGSQYFVDTVLVEIDGVDYHALSFSDNGGGPNYGIYFDGYVRGADSNTLTMKLNTEVSNIREFGHMDATVTDTGISIIGSGYARSSTGAPQDGLQGASDPGQLQIHGSGLRYGTETRSGAGRSTLGWFQWGANDSSTINYVHMKTSLWAGGSGTSVDGFSGNSQFLMAWFEMSAYRYSNGGTAYGQIGFHNWQGSALSIGKFGSGSWTDLANNAYTSSDGHIVLVARINGAYGGFTVNMHQTYYGYPTRDFRVTNFTTSNSNTGAY